MPRAHHIEVTRTARYWVSGNDRGPGEIWIVLHGYKQLARRFIRRFEPIDDGTRLIVAPEALSRFYVSAESGRHGSGSIVGATWMTREEREQEIHDYVRYLDALYSRIAREVERTVPLTILGFSQGVATATRWVTHGTVSPQRLILWGDFTPPDLDLALARTALENVDVTMVRGSGDAALSPRLAAGEAGRLSGASIAYRTVTYEGGHDIDAETLAGLARER